MRPRIAIMSRSFVNQSGASIQQLHEPYRKMVLQCGGNPILMLPPQEIDYQKDEISPLTEEEKSLITAWLDLCDGLLLPGGLRLFEHDFVALEYAVAHNMPVLGICLGMQSMLRYHQPKKLVENGSSLEHHQKDVEEAHLVTIDKNSKLYRVLGKESFFVNSLHHYHGEESSIYKSVAFSDDGIIEAVEKSELSFHIGVQWHPELLPKKAESLALFESFIEASLNY